MHKKSRRPSSSKKCVWLSIALGALSMLAKETGVTILLLNLAFDFYRCWPFVKRSVCALKIEKKCTGLSVRTVKVLVSLALLSQCVGFPEAAGVSEAKAAGVYETEAAGVYETEFADVSEAEAAEVSDTEYAGVSEAEAKWCVQRHTPAVIGLLLLVIPFVPASNLLVTVGFVIAERVLYIPRADLATLPQNAKLHYNLGNFLRETEQQESAIKHYKEALRLWPSYASAHNNIGTLVSRSENAEHHFLQAIKFNKYHVNAHYNLGKLYKKTGRTIQAVTMLEKCVWLQPQFVQAYVELLTLKPEVEKHRILTKLVDLDPNNWEHFVLFGDWLKTKGLPLPASKYYLEALRLSFRYRNVDKHGGEDLLSFRATALMYRLLGQKSRTLQLLTRWHTWRRGWPSAAAAHMYLRDWRLKMELEGRVQIYSKAVNPIKSTKCFDHTRLSMPQQSDNAPEAKTIEPKSAKRDNSECEMKSCGTKRRNLSISSQIKTTHNKSEIGLKEKKCLHRKDDAKSKSVMPKMAPPLAEHILLKTF
ncbi:unnamed protein product [Chilo suppressalis]|uniref:Dolichyl-phosphate-mannose--protein mannosyltransferase n=1 Tax=Chilo suppressalis TaxID=168631 RepID=A0ABN8APQ2_CHISP|nr:unnamed protein product [Chilo suppressalis]